MGEMFPSEGIMRDEPRRMSTPEFWNHWCKRNGKVEQVRGPMWQAHGPDEELQILFDAQQAREEVGDKRKWMSAMFRRLKQRGRSDARCRECVALHLPRGTGPKDADAVQTFSEGDVKACRRTYNDEVLLPVRNIQKVVYEMREQRRVLQNSRQKLYNVTMDRAHGLHIAGGMKQFAMMDDLNATSDDVSL